MVPCSTFVLPGNAMMVLTPFVSLMTTPYMVLVGMLSSRIGAGGSWRETPQLLEPEVMPSTPSIVTWLDLGEGLGGWLAPCQTKHRENTEDWMLKIAPGNGPFYKAFCDKEYIVLSVPLESCLRFLISKFESLVESMRIGEKKQGNPQLNHEPTLEENQPGAVALPADWQIHGMRMHVWHLVITFDLYSRARLKNYSSPFTLHFRGFCSHTLKDDLTFLK